ncbi:hypothetical protein [Bartonella kosoyi]|nr:hypothetical protein [Bartonella kosoyi]
MVTAQILQDFINTLQTAEYHAAKWHTNGMSVDAFTNRVFYKFMRKTAL